MIGPTVGSVAGKQKGRSSDRPFSLNLKRRLLGFDLPVALDGGECREVRLDFELARSVFVLNFRVDIDFVLYLLQLERLEVFAFVALFAFEQVARRPQLLDRPRRQVDLARGPGSACR